MQKMGTGGLVGALVMTLLAGCTEAPPTPYIDLGPLDGGPRDGGPRDSDVQTDVGAGFDADSGGEMDAAIEVDVGRTMATGEPRLVIVDLSEGAPVAWRDAFNGGGEEIPIGTNLMSDPILIGSADVPVSMVRVADESVLYTMMYPSWSEPPLELVIAFGNIPAMGWVTNAVTHTLDHLEPSASRTSLKVSNGDAMSIGGWDIFVRSPATGEQAFTGVTFGNTSGAALVARSSVQVTIRYFIGIGITSTHTWSLPALDEDRYHLVIMEETQRAWLVGESVPTLTMLD